MINQQIKNLIAGKLGLNEACRSVAKCAGSTLFLFLNFFFFPHLLLCSYFFFKLNYILGFWNSIKDIAGMFINSCIFSWRCGVQVYFRFWGRKALQASVCGRYVGLAPWPSSLFTLLSGLCIQILPLQGHPQLFLSCWLPGDCCAPPPSRMPVCVLACCCLPPLPFLHFSPNSSPYFSPLIAPSGPSLSPALGMSCLVLVSILLPSRRKVLEQVSSLSVGVWRLQSHDPSIGGATTSVASTPSLLHMSSWAVGQGEKLCQTVGQSVSFEDRHWRIMNMNLQKGPQIQRSQGTCQEELQAGISQHSHSGDRLLGAKPSTAWLRIHKMSCNHQPINENIQTNKQK